MDLNDNFKIYCHTSFSSTPCQEIRKKKNLSVFELLVVVSNIQTVR